MFKDISAKTSILVGVLFLTVTGGLYPFKGIETIAVLMWFTILAAAIFIWLGIATFFEKNDSSDFIYHPIPQRGIKIKTNIFPVLLFLFYYGSITLMLYIFDVPLNIIYILISLALVVAGGGLLRRYTLYPDRIVIFDILEFPWIARIYITIYIRDIIAINSVNFSIHQAGPGRLIHDVVNKKPDLAFLKLASLVTRKGSSQTLVIRTANSSHPYVMVDVYHPENLISTIKMIKESDQN